VKGHFESLSRINTAAVLIVLSIGISTQTEPRFISEKCKFLDQEHRRVLPAKPVTKMSSSLAMTFLLLEPVFFFHKGFFLVYFFFLRKAELKYVFTSSKIVGEVCTPGHLR
jgi:hypothetical protein